MAIAAAAVTAVAVAGGLVWAAVVSAPSVTVPPPPDAPVLPYPPLTPPPTVLPPDFWGPRPRPEQPGTGLSTAGTKVTFGSGDKTKTVQLPPNVYVRAIANPWDMIDCFFPRCAALPAFLLQVVGGKLGVTVDADLTIWMDTGWMLPEEDRAFDWLFDGLGVAKGSEIRVGPPGTN